MNNIENLLGEYNISDNEYMKIRDIIFETNEEIKNGRTINVGPFEKKILDVFGGNVIAMNRKIDYHFCEAITKAFKDDGECEELFANVYGKMAKYKNVL